MTYIAKPFPYANVHVLEHWKWKTIFRFKVGRHLSRKVYLFDDMIGFTYNNPKWFRFFAVDEIQWDLIEICHKLKLRHFTGGSAPSGLRGMGFFEHRRVHRFIRGIKARGYKFHELEPRTYIVTKR